MRLLAQNRRLEKFWHAFLNCRPSFLPTYPFPFPHTLFVVFLHIHESSWPILNSEQTSMSFITDFYFQRHSECSVADRIAGSTHPTPSLVGPSVFHSVRDRELPISPHMSSFFINITWVTMKKIMDGSISSNRLSHHFGWENQLTPVYASVQKRIFYALYSRSKIIKLFRGTHIWVREETYVNGS